MSNDPRKQKSPNELSRRDFLALAGVTTATLALSGDALAQIPHATAGDSSHNFEFNQAQLAGTHDLPSLPKWGPYSKKFFGISHVPDVRHGLSFDVSIFPSLAQGPVMLPSVTDRSGVHPWEASCDLDFYSYRLETISKDQLYCDLSFCRLDDHRRLIRAELVNETSASQEIVLNCFAQLCFPPLQELTAEPIRLCDVDLPRGAVWVHALDYLDLQFATPRPTDNLVPDGRMRGEMRHHDCVGGSAIADHFGAKAGDTVRYEIRLAHAFARAVLMWRFQAAPGDSTTFQMNGPSQQTVTFKGTGEFTTVSVPLGALSSGTYNFSFISRGGSAVVLNGFVLVEKDHAAAIRFPEKPWHPEPQIDRIGASSVLLQYRDAPDCYGIATGSDLAMLRQVKWRELDSIFHNQSSAYTRQRIFGNGHGRAGDPDSLFVHTASQPFNLPAHSRRIINSLVCTGSDTEVRKSLQGFNPQSAENDRLFHGARAKIFQVACLPSGEPFRFSQQRMAAVTLTNLVYPLYTQRNYIRHYSPGKIWDCLYTWDSGFIGLGLLELDPQQALDDLNAYTTPEGAQSAFIHHGTPLPTQIYLYWELWNRTQSKKMLAYFYPRLRQYHRFLLGRLGSSTTRKRPDGLLATWDYFYNSGGWDDYPPQKFVHQQNLTGAATPIVNSSHAIRCAKLLRQAAIELGHSEDCAEYDRDIESLSRAIQQYSWDPVAGYFGYVMHDAAGDPSGILRAADGSNFNMGLDGVMPLLAGICTPDQQQRILEHMFSEKHLWTSVGITTVDQSASYYSPDGYWNGSVWFAHQWFLWKTMLDLGRGDLAVRIAKTALEVWKQVTDSTYDCMEHFYPRLPFGAGWVQFSSLSSPALSWFSALYTPGRITCGFDTWIRFCEFRNGNKQLHLRLALAKAETNKEHSILACMPAEFKYRVYWNGGLVSHEVVHDGLLQIQIPGNEKIGELEILPV